MSTKTTRINDETTSWGRAMQILAECSPGRLNLTGCGNPDCEIFTDLYLNAIGHRHVMPKTGIVEPQLESPGSLVRPFSRIRAIHWIDDTHYTSRVSEAEQVNVNVTVRWDLQEELAKKGLLRQEESEEPILAELPGYRMELPVLEEQVET